MKELADKINNHLSNGGFVQVVTYSKATMYTSKHAGWFSIGADECLYLKHGKNNYCLSNGNGLLVGIRFGVKN